MTSSWFFLIHTNKFVISEKQFLYIPNVLLAPLVMFMLQSDGVHVLGESWVLGSEWNMSQVRWKHGGLTELGVGRGMGAAHVGLWVEM